jgi:hypothetical protein
MNGLIKLFEINSWFHTIDWSLIAFVTFSISKDNPVYIRVPRVYYWELSKYHYYKNKNIERKKDRYQNSA